MSIEASTLSLKTGESPWPALAARVARHRLVQFVVVGSAMFALAPAVERPELVAVDSRTVAALRAADLSVRSAPGAPAPADPTTDVRQRYLEDEVLYREGLRLGLDQDDGIIRQRLVQKVLFMAEELGGASRPPTEGELRAFHASHAGRFQRPAHMRFRQIYARERAALPAAAEAAWRAGAFASPVGPELAADAPDLVSLLGADFTAHVAALPPQRWSAPVASAYGWHRVFVLEQRAAHPATFEEARPAVTAEFVIARRQEAIAHYLASAFARYRIEIDGRLVTGLAPSLRLALRSVAAPED